MIKLGIGTTGVAITERVLTTVCSKPPTSVNAPGNKYIGSKLDAKHLKHVWRNSTSVVERFGRISYVIE